MQQIVIEEPYEFIKPHRGRLWPWLFRYWLPRHLRLHYGITEIQCRGTERLRASLSAGDGIVLAPNHCRPCDPFVLGLLSREAGTLLYTMASWHLFKQRPLSGFIIRRIGAFSVYREGPDRAALDCAVDILVHGDRPLVLFPEGVITRTNDQLAELMDGTSFVARAAARKRRAQHRPGRVVVHPVAIKYLFGGDLEASLRPTLDDIELRLGWQPKRHRPLLERIHHVGNALLCLKEVEFFGAAQTGSVYRRLQRLIDRLLVPIENEWLKGPQPGDVVGRVKKLRAAILPEMVRGGLDREERTRRRRQLADLYLAQQLRFYPRGYVAPGSPPERVLETVERFEEDLTDTARIYAPLKALIEVGEPIPVEGDEPRGNGSERLTRTLHERLSSLLDGLVRETRRGPPSEEAGHQPA